MSGIWSRGERPFREKRRTPFAPTILAAFFLLCTMACADTEPVLPETGGVLQLEEPHVRLPFDLSGFWEARAGIRTQDDPHEKDASIGETRLQLELKKRYKKMKFNITSDFLYDPVLNEHDIKLEEGDGFIDLREANVTITPVHFMDVKVGRQILTWGTGGLIFVNDLFPKDYNSFVIGRDVEYLKAPSDALKVGLFSDFANLDIVYTPRFDSDRFIDGRRVSYFNPGLGRRAGRDAVVEVEKPDNWFKDDEIALRLYRKIDSYELAAYAYRGFWKSPGGVNPFTGKAIFPDLSVYGASFQGPIARGIGSVEIGYYDSEDRSGKDIFVRNSELRFLAGYEIELARDFKGGFWYYLEYMMDHDKYILTLPPGAFATEKDHHTVAVEFTKLLLNQHLKLSLFTFYSPSAQDAYLRPLIHYDISDYWSTELGANLFFGEQEQTVFGQLEKNNNVYLALRYAF